MAKKKTINPDTLKNIFLGIAITTMTLSFCSFILACIEWQFLIFGIVLVVYRKKHS